MFAGYINQSHPKAGYYFSLLATLLGAALLFLVGGPGATDWEDVPQSLPPPTPLAICGRPRLHKSISFATPLDIPEEYWRPVRSCRSVPEGLGRQQPLTVVEQITTSVWNGRKNSYHGTTAKTIAGEIDLKVVFFQISQFPIISC